MIDPSIVLQPMVTLPVIAVAAVVIIWQWFFYDNKLAVKDTELTIAEDRRLSHVRLSNNHADELAELQDELMTVRHQLATTREEAPKAIISLIVAAEKEMAKRVAQAVERTVDSIVKIEKDTGYSLHDGMTDPAIAGTLIHAVMGEIDATVAAGPKATAKKSGLSPEDERMLDLIFGKGQRPPIIVVDDAPLTGAPKQPKAFSLRDLEDALGLDNGSADPMADPTRGDVRHEPTEGLKVESADRTD